MTYEEPTLAATLLAWTILVLGWLLPLAHVTLSRRSGSWLPPPGSRCPLGPRLGWITLVLLLGPLGWLLYWRSRRRA
ncbi:MAG: hypothetical protein ACREDZ_01620 [Kiloniellales bacterium]